MLHVNLIPQTILISEAKRGKVGNVMSRSLGDWHVTFRENMVTLRKGSKWPRRKHIPQTFLNIKRGGRVTWSIHWGIVCSVPKLLSIINKKKCKIRKCRGEPRSWQCKTSQTWRRPHVKEPTKIVAVSECIYTKTRSSWDRTQCRNESIHQSNAALPFLSL